MAPVGSGPAVPGARAELIERDAHDEARAIPRRRQRPEWASYGPDARAIAAAFVRGINAWVARARERPPEEFVLAGWKPEFWSPEDLLNRTDAFLSSGDAIADVRRLKLSEIVAETIGRVGAPPFFAGLAADVDPCGESASTGPRCDLSPIRSA